MLRCVPAHYMLYVDIRPAPLYSAFSEKRTSENVHISVNISQNKHIY